MQTCSTCSCSTCCRNHCLLHQRMAATRSVEDYCSPNGLEKAAHEGSDWCRPSCHERALLVPSQHSVKPGTKSALHCAHAHQLSCCSQRQQQAKVSLSGGCMEASSAAGHAKQRLPAAMHQRPPPPSAALLSVLVHSPSGSQQLVNVLKRLQIALRQVFGTGDRPAAADGPAAPE